MHHSVPDHASHDQNLIARHAAGDLSNLETAAATALVSSCSTCAELHRDLIVISTATRALPRSARVPRDFRLTAEQAAHLRRGSWLRGLLRPFAAVGSATKPMAAAFTSVGLAGLVVASIVPSLLGGAASAPQRDLAAGPAATAAPVAIEIAPGSAAAPGAFNASGDPDNVIKEGPDASGIYGAAGGGTTASDDGAGNAEGGADLTSGGDAALPAASQPNLLVIGSIVLLLAGLALFGLRFAARRLR
jgi:hypothetical protein